MLPSLGFFGWGSGDSIFKSSWQAFHTLSHFLLLVLPGFPMLKWKAALFLLLAGYGHHTPGQLDLNGSDASTCRQTCMFRDIKNSCPNNPLTSAFLQDSEAYEPCFEKYQAPLF